MSYEQLLERSVEAQTRGNDELAKALFERAMDLKSRRQESPESKEEYKSDAWLIEQEMNFPQQKLWESMFSSSSKDLTSGDSYNPSTHPGMFRGYWNRFLTQVTVGENEAVESALRRFKREVVKAGTFNELRRIRHHETPVEKYKRKQRLRNKSRRRGRTR